MVLLGADEEDRQRHVVERHRPALDAVARLGQLVLQVKPAQVLAVHRRRHARGVGVPGHQVIRPQPLAHPQLAQRGRPDQLARVQELEAAGHLAPGQEARAV